MNGSKCLRIEQMNLHNVQFAKKLFPLTTHALQKRLPRKAVGVSSGNTLIHSMTKMMGKMNHMMKLFGTAVTMVMMVMMVMMVLVLVPILDICSGILLPSRLRPRHLPILLLNLH